VSIRYILLYPLPFYKRLSNIETSTTKARQLDKEISANTSLNIDAQTQFAKAWVRLIQIFQMIRRLKKTTETAQRPLTMHPNSKLPGYPHRSASLHRIITPPDPNFMISNKENLVKSWQITGAVGLFSIPSFIHIYCTVAWYRSCYCRTMGGQRRRRLIVPRENLSLRLECTPGNSCSIPRQVDCSSSTVLRSL
jgi:hypothetical protein